MHPNAQHYIARDNRKHVAFELWRQARQMHEEGLLPEEYLPFPLTGNFEADPRFVETVNDVCKELPDLITKLCINQLIPGH